MRIKLTGGRIYDPSQNWNGEVRDLFVEDGRIVADRGWDAHFDADYDVSGKVVMAGAIDIHSHIAGGNANTARVLLPEQHRNFMARRLGHPHETARWSTVDTGYRYARLGYTTVVEPAVLPANALDAHLQMADIPIIDKAAMFAAADLVFKNGELVVANGAVIRRPTGTTQIVLPEFDCRIERHVQDYFDRFYSLKLKHFTLDALPLGSADGARFRTHAVKAAA